MKNPIGGSNLILWDMTPHTHRIPHFRHFYMIDVRQNVKDNYTAMEQDARENNCNVSYSGKSIREINTDVRIRVEWRREENEWSSVGLWIYTSQFSEVAPKQVSLFIFRILTNYRQTRTEKQSAIICLNNLLKGSRVKRDCRRVSDT